MPLWIGIHLPQLSLDAVLPRFLDRCVCAVLEREQVIALSEEARLSGIRPGMRRGGVMAIAPDTILFERQVAQELQLMQGAAVAMMRYTPEIVMESGDIILMNVTASLTLFRGAHALVQLVRRDLATLGLAATVKLAPTAWGAWLLSQSPASKRTLKLSSLHRELDRLPCQLMPELQPYRDWIEGIGCRVFADIRKLPRAGLKRRCSNDVLNRLDQAYGLAPEMFKWMVLPELFDARYELMERIEHAEAALFVGRRLILQLIGWLALRQMTVSKLIFSLEHERGRQAVAPTSFEIALAEPSFEEGHLTRLVKERLARIELTAPVIAVRLDAQQLQMQEPVSDTLFPEPGGKPSDHKRLIELLVSRLGENAVLMPAPLADHRPELNNQWIPVIQKRRRARELALVPVAERPIWLLASPVNLMVRDERPFYGSPLRLLGAAERIESGWWDDQLAVRDCFVAQGQDAACYWVYRQRAGERISWYLHGLFG